MDFKTHRQTDIPVSQLAAPSAEPAAAGSIQITGDPDFDSDSISNADANQWRWLSFPGSRLTLNPVPGREAGPEKRWVVPPLAEDLHLDLGGFIKNKVFRLMDLFHVALIDKESGEQTAAFRSSAWYPYKIAFDAAYPGDAHIFGEDFLPAEGDVALRTMTVEGARGEHLRIGGTIPDGTVAHWNSSSRTLCFTGEAFSYGLAFLRPENGSETPLKLSIQPRITGTTWELKIPMLRDVENLGIAFAFAPGANEEAEVAVRIDNAIALPMDESLAVAKSRMDALLAKVPMPTLWGCGQDGATAVSPENHRRAYYAAWAFLIQNLIDALPENPEYPYTQISVGKSSLWDEGEETSPAGASWESLFGCQWLAYICPETAWEAYEGMMSRVDDEGKLGGESLPSRKAQTAWILHTVAPDRERLAKAYAATKRYLLWREKNPRWIYPGFDFADEKDMEFVASWLVDVDYAREIAQELGLVDDDAFWAKKQAAMAANMREWFYSATDTIHQFYFTERQVHEIENRSTKVSIMLTSALGYQGLPADIAERTLEFFRSVFSQEGSLRGFCRGKYPDLNLTAYGLIERKAPEARDFIDLFLQQSIAMGDFAEEVNPGPKPNGVMPSLFSPLTIIEFTWLLNNTRYDTGVPASFAFKGE